MAIKFNPYIITTNAARWRDAFNASTWFVRFFPSSVTFPTGATDATTANNTTGYLWSASYVGSTQFQLTGNKVYAATLTWATANAVATGTISWAAIYSTAANWVIYTDSVSASAGTSMITVSTLNAVSGQPLSISALSFTLGAL